MAGWQRADVAIEGEGLGNAAEQIEAHRPGRLGLAGHAAAGEQRLDLGGEAEGPAVVGGVERLDAVGITGQEQPLARLVPDGQGEHAPQALQHVPSLQGIEVQQGLGVGTGAEAHALALQVRAQGREIIDLAVVGDDQAPVGAGHGLGRAVGRIDDGQPPVAEAAATVAGPPGSGSVRAPGGHGVADSQHLPLVWRIRRGAIGQDAI